MENVQGYFQFKYTGRLADLIYYVQAFIKYELLTNAKV